MSQLQPSRNPWTAFNADRRAVTALEYGLIAALIAAVIIGGVAALGTTLSSIYTQASTLV